MTVEPSSNLSHKIAADPVGLCTVTEIYNILHKLQLHNPHIGVLNNFRTDQDSLIILYILQPFISHGHR